MGTNLDEEVLNIAKEKGCRVIATGYDTFIASRLICQAIPVSYAMTPKDKLAVFSINDFVDDVKEEMTQKRFRYFPVLDADNKFVGLVSRRRLLEIDKKRLILVDHNEVSQAVEDWKNVRFRKSSTTTESEVWRRCLRYTSETSRWDAPQRLLLRCTGSRAWRLQNRLQDFCAQQFFPIL